jgi:amidase
MQDLAFQSATELALALRQRKVTSSELLELYLARIDQLNPRVNAVITLDADRARARARELDAQLARSGPVGPLHGLPMTIKDAHETAGIRTTGGATAYADYVPAQNAAGVQRLIDAGAVIFGKTNLPAYSSDMQSYNDLFGVTNNPHDLTRTPGGSSGGAAVAVACGFTAFEYGSDIGGSIRTPATWTGIYGHKPSFGIVPARGHIPPGRGALSEPDLSVCGPLARSAQDLALALDVLAGPDQAHARAFTFALPAPRARALSEYRIALWLDDPAFPVDREVKDALERAAQALERAGARVDRNARPDLTLAEVYDNYTKLLNPIIAAGFPKTVIDGLLQAARTTPEQPDEAPMLKFARNATARHIDWMRANERRAHHNARWADFFQRFDVLLCPVTGVAAIKHDHEGSPLSRTLTINGATRPYMDLAGWISMATASHLPATVAPIGRTPGGLPVGVQIIGPYLEDRTPIDVAARMADVVGGFEPPAGY